MAARLVARTVRGIEPVVAEEIRQRGLGQVERLGHREVWFRCASADVLRLRCADDVYLVGSTVDGIGRGKDSLRLLAKAASALPVRELLALRARFGGSPDTGSVDVSASFLGRRNYNRFDIEDAVGESLGLRYHSRRNGTVPPQGGMSWRVTVVDDQALLALRIGDRPLHRRDYRTVSRPGSLHPPLAAAMVRLAFRDGDRLLDPFCGTGTIPIEAAMAGCVSIVGSDRDLGAVAAARVNGRATSVGWVVADAGRLPVVEADLVVSNPPWGRQVPAAGILAKAPWRFWRELRRVLRPDGRAVLLMPGARPGAGFEVVDRIPVSVSGQHPEIVVVR